MSAKQMGLVFDLELPHNLQSVLLAVADHADHNGENAFPSVALIAWKTGYTDRNVQLLLRKLEARGILVKQRDPGRHRPKTYRIVLASVARKVPLVRRRRDEKISPMTREMRGEIRERMGEISTVRGEISSSPEPSFVNRPQEPYAPFASQTRNDDQFESLRRIADDEGLSTETRAWARRKLQRLEGGAVA